MNIRHRSESKQFIRKGAHIICKYCEKHILIGCPDEAILRRSREFRREHARVCDEKTRMIEEL